MVREALPDYDSAPGFFAEITIAQAAYAARRERRSFIGVKRRRLPDSGSWNGALGGKGVLPAGECSRPS